MPIVIHTEVIDEDLRAAAREALEGEIKSMTREQIEAIVAQAAAKKAVAVFSNRDMERLIEQGSGANVRSWFSETGAGSRLSSDMRDLLRSEVNKVITERLNQGKLL